MWAFDVNGQVSLLLQLTTLHLHCHLWQGINPCGKSLKNLINHHIALVEYHKGEVFLLMWDTTSSYIYQVYLPKTSVVQNKNCSSLLLISEKYCYLLYRSVLLCNPSSCFTGFPQREQNYPLTPFKKAVPSLKLVSHFSAFYCHCRACTLLCDPNWNV